MRKLSLLAVCLFVSASVAKAQKVEGTLDFLGGCNELHFVFEYNGMMVKKQTEQQYVAETVKEKNKEKKGKGNEWKTEWETTTREYIQSVFVKDFNQEISEMKFYGGEYPNAKYIATVKTIWLDPGYMAGPMTKPSIVTIVVTFTKTGSSATLATVTIKKAKGSIYDFGNTFGTDAHRIGSSYGEAGELLGKAVKKVLKKK